MFRVLRSGASGLVDENATPSRVAAIMLLARRYLRRARASADVMEEAGTGLMLWYCGAIFFLSSAPVGSTINDSSECGR